MKLRAIVREMYRDFVERYYKSSTSIDNDDIIVDWLIEVHKKINLNSISARWIYRYLIYQFDYWKNKNVRHGNKMSIKKIFAKKSLERYFNRSSEYNWYNAAKSLEQYDINESILKSYESRHQKTNIAFDDVERARYYNTDKGLANCIETTTLYDNRSKFCIVCKNRKVCKQILQENYKALYIDRYVRKNNNRPLQSV